MDRVGLNKNGQLDHPSLNPNPSNYFYLIGRENPGCISHMGKIRPGGRNQPIDRLDPAHDVLKDK